MNTGAWFDQLYKEQLSDQTRGDEEIANRIEARLFPQQRDFILDPARQKAALCPRRAGKSYCVLSYALITALRKPGSQSLIIGKVRKQVKKVYWQTLKMICKEMEIKAHFRNMELECELPNNSVVYFAGADNIEEIEKFRGPSYDLCCVDEGKSYSPHLLKELIIDILKPALLDKQGTLVLIGTPGAIPSGPFWAVTSGTGDKNLGNVRRWSERNDPKWFTKGGRRKPARWSLHTWSSRDIASDPKLKNHPGFKVAQTIWKGALEDKEQAGWPDDHPSWQREYLGQWVPDEDSLVYSYARVNTDGCLNYEDDPNSSELFGLPEGHNWQFVLGVDLGTKDDTSFVIAAWATTHPDLIYLHAEKHTGWQIGDIVKRTKELEDYVGSFFVRIADTGGLGTMVVESMSSLFGVDFIPAKKGDKPAHIKLLNADLFAKRIKVRKASCMELTDEWETLQWADPFHTREDPRSPNHCTDAALYVWRYCYHHLWQAREEAPTPGTPDWWAKKEQEEEDALRRQVLQDQDQDYWQKYAQDAAPPPTSDSIWTYQNLKRLFG